MGKAKVTKKTDVLSASEIGQYHYCSCAWMLQRCGYEPESPALVVGKQFHVALGDTIDGFEKKIHYARWVAILGLFMLSVAVVLFFIEVVL
ncbi:MAG TPA: hypothetical protein HA258_03160 [Thermoplasmata archaeon]|nr:hypothetical protein [Thermoplasmata archaeon]HIH28890.1 hypothetical protein [Thermoplasmata archaeon]